MFWYRYVLCVDLPWMNQIGRPSERKRIPVVLTVAELQQVLLTLLPGVGAFWPACCMERACACPKGFRCG